MVKADTDLMKTSATTLNPIDTNPTEKPIKTPNPSASIMFFFIVTTVYCGFSMFVSGDSTRTILKICYILFVVIGEFFINLSLSESMCGLRQWSNTLFITVIPWLLIFGVLHFFLIIFPGWMSPFSNTFGFLVVRLMGFPKFLETILNENPPNNATTAINMLKTDNSMLINELFMEPLVDGKRENYDTAIKRLTESKLFKDLNTPDNKPDKDKLYTFVVMKHSIAEYVWNILSGFLVTSVTYNQIINSTCKNSATEMKTRYDKYEAGEKKRIENKRTIDKLNNTSKTTTP